MKPILRTVIVCSLLSAGVARAQTPAAGGAGGNAGTTQGAAGTGGAAPAAPSSTPAAAPAAPAAPAPAAPAKPAAPAPAPQVINVTPPATLTPTTTSTPSDKSSAGGGSGLSLSPTTPAFGGGTNITAKQAESLTPTTSAAGGPDEWKFDFHGYMRAPLRISIGPPSPVVPPVSAYNSMPPAIATQQPYPIGSSGPPGLQLHSPPRVPGYLYTTWEFTNTVGGPWAQLNFSYGNSKAMMTVIVDSYNQTDGSYRNIQAQQGIDQAFLTLNFPDALGDLGTLVWNIGTFQNRYGTAGKYDGGMYETYLFGRTHISGETLTANITNVDAAGNWSIWLEHGFGAKLDLVPFLNNQFYQVFSNVPSGSNNGAPYLSSRDAEYLPYAGPVPMGSTFVHHAHIGAKYQKLLTFGLHYIYTWTPDDNWDPINSRLPNGSDLTPRSQGPIQGSMAITGAEARLSGGVYGDGYLGYSHIDARNINALADSIEVMHSYGGYQFKQNFFGKTYDQHTGFYTGPENETGTVDNVSVQYSFSFGQLARYPEDFWGDGPDLVVTVFGLLSVVNSPAPPLAVAAGHAKDWDMSTKKLKWGFDALYTPLDWIGFGGRFDYVQPDLDAAYAREGAGEAGGSQLNFGVINLRAVIKTAFVTHETVTLQYGHYFLGSGAYPSYPYTWVAKADSDIVGLSATMWW